MSFTENNSAFSYYKCVANLLYVYGDKHHPNKETVEMVHLQLQELLSEMFSKDIVSALVRKTRKQNESSEDIYHFSEKEEEEVEMPQVSNTRLRRVFQRYLQFVFSEYYCNFIQLQKNLEKVEKKCYMQERFHEDYQESLYQEAISRAGLGYPY